MKSKNKEAQLKKAFCHYTCYQCTTLHETVQCTIMYVTYGFPKNELSL